MGNKSKETFKKIKELQKQGKTLEEILENCNIKQDTVKKYIKIIQKGFESYTGYHEFLAKQKGFKSHKEYKEFLAKQKGFKSYTEYQEFFAKQKGFKSYTEYQEFLAKQKGFKSHKEYKEFFAKQRGFKSYTEYQNGLSQKRKKHLKNKVLSKLIYFRLRELKKSQKWLAKEIGFSTSSISKYAGGYLIPLKERQSRIFEALKMPYNSLDEIIEDKDNLPDYLKEILKDKTLNQNY